MKRVHGQLGTITFLTNNTICENTGENPNFWQWIVERCAGTSDPYRIGAYGAIPNKRVNG